MANQWLRLWHDMPNDPKWRTISRASSQRLADVVAVYIHILVSASQNVTRGHVNVTAEDIASAIDVTEEVVQQILDAMQGRVLDGVLVSGWVARQPKREDAGDSESGAKSAAERKQAQREREKQTANQEKIQGDSKDGDKCHAMSRNVTTDKDKDKDSSKPPISPKGDDKFDRFWKAYPRKQGKGAAEKAFKKAHINGDYEAMLTALELQKRSDQWRKDNGQFIPNPATWINQRRWEDEIPGGIHPDGTSPMNGIFRGAI